ncbi:MAG: four-carbon acid sugar kinase family protein [Acidobacteriaceae bacterium]|jgi:uncharacterized protein YgbK (DUF1537 family)
MQTGTLNSRMRPRTERNRASRIVIVADDLTGACDSGAAFLASGRSVRVMLHPPASNSEIECAPGAGGDVVSYTTETRNLSEERGAARTAEVVAALARAAQQTTLFKKVDSAARGNLGAETIAALTASNAELALVAPAFPQAARTVHSGILSVRDCSGQGSRISLRDQFSAVDSTRVEVLPTGSETGLLLGIRRAIANGIWFLLCDAGTQEDLERLAAAGSQLQQSLLWVGSAGLARALAGTFPVSTPETTLPRAGRPGRTLLFAGSPHPVTRLQLSRLEQQAPVQEHAVVRIEFDATSHQEIHAAFTARPVSALILTGGDTAAFVLKSLGASSILLAGELAPGIPWGFVAGGMADDCMVITKSGGFGGRDALIRALEFCERRSHETA